MKTKIQLLIVILAIFAGYSQAQTNTIPPVSALDVSPSIAHGLSEIASAVETSGLSTATNYAAEAYLTYMQSAPKGDRIGGGLLIVYDISAHIGTALGVDYLGQFSLISGNVTLKLPTHPFSGFGGFWTNVVVTPFALTGAGKPLSGTGAGISAIEDVGAYIGFGKLWGGQFNLGGCYGQWLNAGIYSGTREHIFLGWSKGI